MIAHLGIGGAQKVLVTLANAWAARGWPVTLIAIGGAAPSYFALHPEVKQLSLDLQVRSADLSSALRNNCRRLLQLRRAVRASRPDAVLSFLSATNVLTLLATRGLGVPVLVSERSDPQRQALPAAWRLLRRCTYPLASSIVVQSDAAVAAMAWPGRRLAVVARNPILLPAGLNVRDQPVIVGVGRLVPLKRFDLLIRAFAANASAHPSWRLVVWGDGPERPRLEALAAEHLVGDRVQLPGMSATPGAWLDQAGIFALTSSYEGYPNALAEAMAAGLAVVSTACPIGPCIMIEHGVDGLLVPNGDLQELSRALGQLMQEPELRRRLGAAGRNSRYADSPERSVATWTELMLGAAGRRTRSTNRSVAAVVADSMDMTAASKVRPAPALEMPSPGNAGWRALSLSCRWSG